MLILIHRPFNVGDTIKVKTFEGLVTAIDLRYTRLERDGEKILVPNSLLFTNPISIQSWIGERKLNEPTADLACPNRGYVSPLHISGSALKINVKTGAVLVSSLCWPDWFLPRMVCADKGQVLLVEGQFHRSRVANHGYPDPVSGRSSLNKSQVDERGRKGALSQSALRSMDRATTKKLLELV